MKQVSISEIPEFEIEVLERRDIVREGAPTGAAAITAMGEGGIFQLYVKREQLNGWRPEAGQHVIVQIAVTGTFETRVETRSIRPVTADTARKTA